MKTRWITIENISTTEELFDIRDLLLSENIGGIDHAGMGKYLKLAERHTVYVDCNDYYRAIEVLEKSGYAVSNLQKNQDRKRRYLDLNKPDQDYIAYEVNPCFTVFAIYGSLDDWQDPEANQVALDAGLIDVLPDMSDLPADVYVWWLETPDNTEYVATRLEVEQWLKSFKDK